MRKVLSFTTLALLIISCKKEKTNTPVPIDEPTYTYVTTNGSYWVYDLYDVDSLGNETLLPQKDTIKVTGDTVVNGKTYYKFVGGTLGNSNQVTFQRDSSGYIVSLNHGSIMYSFNNVASVINSFSDDIFSYSTGFENNQNVATAFGVKNAFVGYYQVSKNDGTPINVCNDLFVKFYTHYVSGIGMVQTETAFYSQMMNACAKKRSKLSSYYIAP